MTNLFRYTIDRFYTSACTIRSSSKALTSHYQTKYEIQNEGAMKAQVKEARQFLLISRSGLPSFFKLTSQTSTSLTPNRINKFKRNIACKLQISSIPTHSRVIAQMLSSSNHIGNSSNIFKLQHVRRLHLRVEILIPQSLELFDFKAKCKCFSVLPLLSVQLRASKATLINLLVH